jgi:hypothetical protein
VVEASDVDEVGGCVQHVAAGLVGPYQADGVAGFAQSASEPGDVCLQGFALGCWWIAVPETVGDGLRGNGEA